MVVIFIANTFGKGADAMPRIKLNNADETDAFSRHRHLFNWRTGRLKRIKRGYNRRFRRLAKLEIRAKATPDR